MNLKKNSQSLQADCFFDLSSFEHRLLFSNIEYVWQALSCIAPYLDELELGNIQVEIPDPKFLDQASHISIGEGTVVEPGAYIRGPCIIGKHCQIRHGAYIRGNVIIGDHCVVGHDTEVKNTVFLNGSQAGHFAYLGDCILGNKVNIGAGVKCANLKLKRDLIKVCVDGITFNTELKKFGAILGDASQLGCNVVTNPGTLFGKGVLCYPNCNIGGVFPSNSLIRVRNKVSVTAL